MGDPFLYHCFAGGGGPFYVPFFLQGMGVGVEDPFLYHFSLNVRVVLKAGFYCL